MGQRHSLPSVAVIDEDGRMTTEAGPYAGQDRFKARKALVEQLQREGLLEKIDDHQHAVGHCDRCGTVVEPLVSTQWFVKIGPLARRGHPRPSRTAASCSCPTTGRRPTSSG